MREHPWHARRATTIHYRWYRDLVDIHSLTLSWLKSLNVERASHFLGPSANLEVRDLVSRMELAAGLAIPLAKASHPEPDPAGVESELHHVKSRSSGLEALLDDTYPEDLLERLERSISIIQVWTLKGIFESASEIELPGLIETLEQSSWRSGKDCASRRWPAAPLSAREELRGLYSLFRDSPLSGRPGQEKLLLVRSTTIELEFELLGCPHRSSSPEVRAVADTLCRLHSHWTRGYLYALNPRAGLEHLPGERCAQRWFLAT